MGVVEGLRYQDSETLKGFLTGPLDRGRVAVGAGGWSARGCV